MENIYGLNLVSDHWDRLATKYCSGLLPRSPQNDEELYREIVDTLIHHCFVLGDDVEAFVRGKLLLAMPQYHANIRNTGIKRKIKLVKETAVAVGCHLGTRYEERNLLFHAALIVLFSMETECMRRANLKLYDNPGAFLANYPECSEFPYDGMDPVEIQKLCVFANYMKIILLFLNQASGHREHAILLAVRITEGRFATYTFGGGASAFTRRRIRIFQKEGGVVPKKAVKKNPVQDFFESASTDPTSFQQLVAGIAGEYPPGSVDESGTKLTQLSLANMPAMQADMAEFKVNHLKPSDGTIGQCTVRITNVVERVPGRAPQKIMRSLSILGSDPASDPMFNEFNEQFALFGCTEGGDLFDQQSGTGTGTGEDLSSYFTKAAGFDKFGAPYDVQTFSKVQNANSNSSLSRQLSAVLNSVNLSELEEVREISPGALGPPVHSDPMAKLDRMPSYNGSWLDSSPTWQVPPTYPCAFSRANSLFSNSLFVSAEMTPRQVVEEDEWLAVLQANSQYSEDATS